MVLVAWITRDCLCKIELQKGTTKMGDIIYLDNAATTQTAAEVYEAMKPFFDEYYGNAASVYRFAGQSTKAVDEARAIVADFLGAKPKEIYFTSGGSESDNWALNPSYHGVSFYDAVGPAAFVTYIRAILLRDTGATISPFNAFLLLQGTETLSLRLDRHAENTKKVVEFLKNHPQVESVNHPSLEDHPDHELYTKYFPNGGASIFTFNIKGGKEEAWKFIDNLEIFSLLANVADVKSLVIHPASTTHSQLTDEELEDQGIKQSTIRLSIGTEHIDDIIADLEKGFAALK